MKPETDLLREACDARYLAILEKHDHSAKKAVLVPIGLSLDFDEDYDATRRWLWPYLGDEWHLQYFVPLTTAALSSTPEPAALVENAIKTCEKCGARAVAFICDTPGCPMNGGLAYPTDAGEPQAARMREALEIIAGRRQCIDNLMSNAEIAEAALASAEPAALEREDRMRRALEQIEQVRADNNSPTCDKSMTLDFIGQVARAALLPQQPAKEG